MVNIEIVVGIIFIAVLGAVFIPLAFDVGGGQGVTAEQIGNLTQFDNFEWARAGDFSAESTSSPRLFVDVFNNYKLQVLEFSSVGNPSSAVWTSAIPDQFNATSASPRLDIYWYKDTDGNDGGVCWGMTGKAISEFEILDVTFNVTKTVCRASTASPVEIDTLNIDIIEFAEGELIPSTDRSFVIISITRNLLNATDTLNADANLIGLRIIWDTDPDLF